MKHIALISFHTCPLSGSEGKEIGGMNIYVFNLAKNLVEKGFIVDVYTRNQDEKSPKVVEVSKNFRVIHITAGPKTAIPKKNLVLYTDEFTKNVHEFMQAEHLAFDVLDCHYYLSGLIGVALKQRYNVNIPLCMTFHTLALMKNLVARTEEEKESQERINAEILLAQQANIIFSPSETDKEYLIYLYQCKTEKIQVVSPGVDTKLFKPSDQLQAKQQLGIGKDEHIILFAGRIEPLKGIDVLMYAVKILLEKLPHCPISLWIVGGDVSQKTQHWSDELQKLEELRRQLGIEASVKFVGRKLPQELPLYFNAADLVVAPSQYESFGLTALEAMACGTPIITTDATGVSTILDEKHQALITSANNPLLLASQMEYLLTNGKAYSHLSEEVYKKVQDLSWENITKKVIKIYKQL